MARSRRLVALVTGVMVVLAGFATAGGAQTEDLAAWCQARVDAEAAFGSGDEDAIAAALAALTASAPADIAADTATVVTGLQEKGEKAFDDEDVQAAGSAVDEYVAANCGFPVTEVTTIDYEFQGIPDSLPAGLRVFHVINDAPQEVHEIVYFRVNDGVKLSAKKLLSLPQKKVEKKVTFSGAAGPIEPGGTAASIATLEPGRYVVGCFLPVGGKKKGKPHVTKGMFAEFEVPAA